MSAENADPALIASTLWQAWTEGRVLESLPADATPRDPVEGHAAQAALARLAGPSIGWKIAATSTAGQRHIGVDGPLLGRLFERFAFEDGATLPAQPLHMAVVEAEFAFRIGRDLDGDGGLPVSREEAIAAVEALHLAIEIPDSRLSGFESVGAAQLIADDACAGRFVLGPEVADWRGLDLAAQETEIRVDNVVAANGVGANVLGDPREALVWAANALIEVGERLRAGDVLTTGTTTVPPHIALGSRVVADFGELGSVRLRFAES